MKIFVASSSSEEIDDKYKNDCKVLLNELLNHNELIFGACSTGLMGLSYRIAHENKQKIFAFCSERYKDELNKLKCDKEVITDTILERTNKLFSESDILLFLPGGIGTLHELVTAIECKRNSEFDKPIIIYNSNGYYDKLLEFLDKIYLEKFSSVDGKKCYFVSDKCSEIIDYINNNVK